MACSRLVVVRGGQILPGTPYKEEFPIFLIRVKTVPNATDHTMGAPRRPPAAASRPLRLLYRRGLRQHGKGGSTVGRFDALDIGPDRRARGRSGSTPPRPQLEGCRHDAVRPCAPGK